MGFAPRKGHSMPKNKFAKQLNSYKASQKSSKEAFAILLRKKNIHISQGQANVGEFNFTICSCGIYVWSELEFRENPCHKFADSVTTKFIYFAGQNLGYQVYCQLCGFQADTISKRKSAGYEILDIDTKASLQIRCNCPEPAQVTSKIQRFRFFDSNRNVGGHL
jgi:hypothetical protein